MKLAIFDFDGTLFPEETFPLLMSRLKVHPKFQRNYRQFMMGIVPVYLAYKCKICPENTMKEFSMRRYLTSFKTASKEEIDQFFYEVGDSMRLKLSDSIIQRLDQHRRDGYYIMLVSGAFEPLLYAVTKDLPIDKIIGTSIPFHQIKEKQFRIDPIQGNRKKEVVQEQFSNMEIDWSDSYAYGDSYSDLAVLELVGNPVVVQPDPRLSEIAFNRKWERM